MGSRAPASAHSHGRRLARAWFALFALIALGCGGNDYYYVNAIEGEGDTLLLEFLFTCGSIDIRWDGSFGALPRFHVELAVEHDAKGEDCAEDPREFAYDVGPMKRSFRAEYPWPTPLGVRIAAYEEEQGAICLPNLFQDEPFKGRICK